MLLSKWQACHLHSAPRWPIDYIISVDPSAHCDGNGPVYALLSYHLLLTASLNVVFAIFSVVTNIRTFVHQMSGAELTCKVLQ